ncbi:MAG TPA: hypothetical protein VHR86_08500, partial [Armatimonadota bacterium]|nr:hypothetical protein [Armatimonadota bacterium]
LQLPDHPEVYCIGDSALAQDPGTNRPAPPNAPAAIQMAELTAQNLICTLLGQPLQSFHYRFKGELLSLGRNQAIAHIGNVLIDGFPGWVFWRSFYINQLMGWENRAGVLADWLFAYFARQRETTRLSFAPSLLEEEGILPEPLAQSQYARIIQER